MEQFLSKYKYKLLFVIGFWIVLEYVALGPFSYIGIHDTGDSFIPRYLAAKLSLSQYGVSYWMPSMACGVDRIANDLLYPHFSTALFLFLPGWLAYQVIILAQVYFGLYFTFKLCKEKLQFSDFTSLFVGIYFVLFSTDFINYHLGIAAFPFILYALDHAHQEWSKKKCFVVAAILGVFYSYSSSLVWTLPFALILIVLWFLVIRRYWKVDFLLILAVFSLMAIICQLTSVMAFLHNAPLSHRADWTQVEGMSVLTALSEIFLQLAFSKLTVVTAIVVLGIMKFKSKLFLKFLMFYIFCTAGAAAIELLTTLFAQQLSFFRGFQFKRFLDFIPFFAGLSIGYGSDLIFLHLKNSRAVLSDRNQKFFKYGVCGILLLSLALKSVELKVAHGTTWLLERNYVGNYQERALEKIANEAGEELFRVASIKRARHPDYAFSYGLETVDGYLNLYPKSYQKFWSKVIEPLTEQFPKWDQYFNKWGNRIYLFRPLRSHGSSLEFSQYYRSNLLSLANTKYIISQLHLEGDYLEPIVEQKNFWLKLGEKEKAVSNLKANFKFGEYVNIYRNKNYLPRVFLTSKIRIFDDVDVLLESLALANIQEIHTTVFLERDLLDGALFSNLGFKRSKLKVNHYSPDRIVVDVDLDGRGILVVSNNYSPSWKCTVNGRPTKIVPAYGTFWGVLLTQSQNEVIFEYQPPYKLFNTSRL